MSSGESVRSMRAEHGQTLVRSGEVLSSVCSELRVLADAVDDLEELVGNLVVAGAFGGSPSIYKLQTLDRLRQSIEGIADFLEGVNDLLPESRIDAALASRVVKLADLSRRLSHQPCQNVGHSDGDCGTFEAFDAA